MTEPTSAQDLFKGRHFDQEIIILCGYLTFKLSSRDLVQMMAERGITLSHTTILRWVQQYVPEFEKRWSRYAWPVGDSWRVDETYLKIKDQRVYLYRAEDKSSSTVDFLLSKRRDVAAAKRFFSRAAKQHGANSEKSFTRQKHTSSETCTRTATIASTGNFGSSMTSMPSSRHRPTTERISFSVANEEVSLPNTITPAEMHSEFRRRGRSRKKPKLKVLSFYEGCAPEGLGCVTKQEACVNQEGRHLVTR